ASARSEPAPWTSPLTRKSAPMLAALLLTVLVFSAAEQPQTVEADVVLRGATLYDGTDGRGRPGDLAIKGDRIVAVGKFEVAGKPRVIDATNLVVAPGFIDLHTHSDAALTRKETRANLCYLKQGV